MAAMKTMACERLYGLQRAGASEAVLRRLDELQARLDRLEPVCKHLTKGADILQGKYDDEIRKAWRDK